MASKALGLVTDDPDKDRVIAGETDHVVAERRAGDRLTRIVQAKAGPVMAAAGVDGSNTGERGGWLLLPHDPDGVCERLHAALTQRHGVRVGVVLSDTAGRPWRVGQVDFALGAHGLHVVDDLRGGVDADGRDARGDRPRPRRRDRSRCRPRQGQGPAACRLRSCAAWPASCST